MKIEQIHQLAIKKGIEADFRGEQKIKKMLDRKKEQYEKMSEKEKEEFDKEALRNPYLDSRILNVAQDEEINKILVGIDIGPAEILLAERLGDIDLILSHHPLGEGLAHLADVMDFQCDVLNQYGIPINVAEGVMKKRISEVVRGVNKANHQRTVDAASLLNYNLMCLHSPCDNLAAKFLRERLEDNDDINRLEDIIENLKEIPEYQRAVQQGAGPKIFAGEEESRCGRIALTEITGGTEPAADIYEKMPPAGIGTVVGMHMEEEHRKQAEEAHVNVVIAGHMSSDSLGINLFLDELEQKGIEIVPCSGFIRVSRN